MKDLIDKVLKPKKTKESPIIKAVEETKADIAPYKVEPAKVKIPNPWPRPLHHPSCVCFKCERWREAEKNA